MEDTFHCRTLQTRKNIVFIFQTCYYSKKSKSKLYLNVFFFYPDDILVRVISVLLFYYYLWHSYFILNVIFLV